MPKTIEIQADDIMAEFDYDELTGDIMGGITDPNRRAVVLANIERRASEHEAESVRAELRGQEVCAEDARDSCSDLRAFVRHVRRQPPPVPRPFGETAKLQAIR